MFALTLLLTPLNTDPELVNAATTAAWVQNGLLGLILILFLLVGFFVRDSFHGFKQTLIDLKNEDAELHKRIDKHTREQVDHEGRTNLLTADVRKIGDRLVTVEGHVDALRHPRGTR